MGDVTIFYIVFQFIHFLVRSCCASLQLCPYFPNAGTSSGTAIALTGQEQGWVFSCTCRRVKQLTYMPYTLCGRGCLPWVPWPGYMWMLATQPASGHPNCWSESCSPFLSVVGLYHIEYLGLNRWGERCSPDFRSLPALNKGGYLKWAQVSSLCLIGVILLVV